MVGVSFGSLSPQGGRRDFARGPRFEACAGKPDKTNNSADLFQLRQRSEITGKR